jgi:hypothetical protein
MRWADRLMGLWLGTAVLLQALLLAADAPLSHAQSVQYFAGAICLMLLVIYFWRSRRYLNSHADMLLIMCASGGLGMLAGMPMPGHAAHETHMAAWWQMCGWMLLFGLAPAIAFSRCLRAARHHGYLLWALLIDCSSMLAGMWVSRNVAIGHGTWMMISQHFTMLGGMTLGMIVGMWIRSALFETSIPEMEEAPAHSSPKELSALAAHRASGPGLRQYSNL